MAKKLASTDPDRQKTFPLIPGGLPIPFSQNLFCLGMAILTFVLAVVGLKALGYDSDGFDYFLAILAIAVYWKIRTHLETRYFVPNSCMRIFKDRVVFPGYIVFQEDDLILRKTQIKCVWLGEQGPKSTIDTVNIDTITAYGRIRLWRGSVADPEQVAIELRSVMGISFTKKPQEYYISHQYDKKVAAFCLLVLILSLTFALHKLSWLL